ncbi:xanthine dehydrogenase family protein molybdopterin-binding subunit [Rhodococcoides fascians]|uniref:xanthine dehydrogenase family protein molybdopterin-binding subunit n=1 Tax=Rhodococcoides fascians TaxID=1828 RepID=UPI000691357B|nr:xanthine dehydrogenase family protein molybdopterin-binding subunit [Rhodococcus fascians]
MSAVAEPLEMVGRATLRVEDRPLLTGKAMFLDDVPLPGDALHVVFVRSTIAHGLIQEIRTEDATAVEGVVGVFTREDLGDVPDLVTPVANASKPPRPILPHDRVRYVGEPIAAVVATSRYIAEDAAGMVDVVIDPLPVVSHIADALDASKPVLHESEEIRSNVLFDRLIEVGDPDAAFAGAAHVVERVFRHPRLVPAPMEGRGAAAYVEDGEVVLWASTQFPHALMECVRDLFGFRVRVKCPDIGGGFGLKSIVSPEDLLVAWLAVKLAHSVKWVEDRAENLTASAHARDFEVTVRAAADADGHLLAIDLDSLGNGGAYSVYPITHVLETAGVLGMTPGPYRLSHYRARGRAVATNTCPAGPYRGVGLPVASLIHERLMDIFAEKVGIDPIEIRRRNLIAPEDLPYITVTGQRYDSGDYPAALEAAAGMLRFEDAEAEQATARENGKLIGVGFASYVEWTGNNSTLFKQRGMSAMKGWDSCQLSLGADGRVKVWTSSPSIGQGSATTYSQVLADTTGIEFDQIDVIQSDTGSGDVDGTGTGSSRSASVTSGAIVLAGGELKDRLLEDASVLLDVPVDRLQIQSGIVSSIDEPTISENVRSLAAKAPDDRYTLGRMFEAKSVLYSYATHGCRIEVDAETGFVKILDWVVAEDCGRIINPLVVEGQTKGAIAQGIAAALYESFHYDSEGQPLAGSFMDYLMPTASEMTNVELRHLTTPAPEGILGAKGVGEGGTIAAGVCLANAVTNALNFEFNELPLHPETLQKHAQSLLRQLTGKVTAP